MLAIDSVGAGGIDHVEFFEQGQWMGNDGKTIVDHRLAETLTPTQQGNLSGGGGHALFQDAFAQQGVNERAFASVKFAGCHDQK